MKAVNTFADFMPPQRARFQGETQDTHARGADGQETDSRAEALHVGAVRGPQPGTDRPITGPEQDVLGRHDFVKRLARGLLATDGQGARGVTLGLTGSWGAGKTSLLNLLTCELSERRPRPIILRFDPWLVSGRDALITDFLGSLAASLTAERRFKEQTARAADQVLSYLGHLAGLADLATPGLGAAVRGGVEAARDGVRTQLALPASLHERKQAVAEALAQVETPIIVLIDEVDRLEDADVRAIAQLIRAVADFEQISYILAYDEARVIEALGRDAPAGAQAARGRAYLEKIVQLQIPVPLATPDELGALVDAEAALALRDVDADEALADPRYATLAGEILPGRVLATPRDVKRFAGQVRALAPMVAGDVNMVDVVGLAALAAKAPELAAALRANPERYVLDPDSDDELRRRLEAPVMGVDGATDPTGELADAAPGIVALHRFLFPAHTKPGDLSGVAKDRICFLRPLLAALRLGPLPEPQGDPVHDLILAESTTVRETLRTAIAEGTISSLMTDLAQAYPGAQDARDEEFWVGVLGALMTLDEQTGFTTAQAGTLIDQLASLFQRRADAVPGFPAAGILSTLVTEGEWNLSAAILRPCWARARLARQANGAGPRTASSLEPEDARNLAFQFAMHARTAHIKGEFLPGLRSLAPVLLLVDMAVWDTQWQSGLQQALVTMPAQTRTRLLALLFADDFDLDDKVRTRIVGNEQILSHLRQLWGSAQPYDAPR